MDNRPIGIFDSGVGGLTVVKQILKELPNENIIYFGDTARLPYGDKSKDTVTKFSKQDIRFLLTKDVKAVIIACNTASSNSIEAVRETFDLPIFGVVQPGVEEALKATKNKKIGVIATEATIRSDAYRQMICEADPEIMVYSRSCPLFVPLVEEGWTYNEVTKLTAEMYLEDFIQKGIDSLVLGCTHYPLLKRCIGETVGERVILVDPARATAVAVKDYLIKNQMLHAKGNRSEKKFYLSDVTNKFSKLCEKALKEIYQAEEIDIEKY
ncbi:MAG: glutamate racemase [Clostridiales bacterium]|nr:glutamate racemase [Clostridiales bacterium]